MTDYHVRILRSDAELLAAGPAWQRLYAATPLNPFLSFEWTVAYRRHLCPDAELFVVAAYSGDQLVGVAPLRRERALSFRVLRFIADGRSDYLGFLTDPACPDAEAALLRALAASGDAWDLALLRSLSGDLTGVERLPTPARFRSAEIEESVAPYLSLPERWEELLASGPSQLRHSKRPARRFERDGGVVQRIGGPDAADHVHDVADVERHSWKIAERCARLQPGGGQELMRDALRALGERGEVELWLARMQGRPVAFLLNFLTPHRVCYYQGAYREDAARWYPGGVLHYHAIRHAWETKRREYDFMRGGEGYKTGWTNAVRPIGYRALYPDSVRGRLAFGTLAAVRWRLRQHPQARAARELWVQLRSAPAALLQRRAAH